MSLSLLKGLMCPVGALLTLTATGEFSVSGKTSHEHGNWTLTSKSPQKQERKVDENQKTEIKLGGNSWREMEGGQIPVWDWEWERGT